MIRRNLSGDAKSWHTNKVYQALSFLDPADHKRFLRFLQSPYFNQSKTLIKLYQQLVKAQLQYTDRFNRTEVWAKLMPGEAYDDVTFRKHCSDLLKLLEQFMSIEARQVDSVEGQLDLLEQAIQKKMEPVYNSVMRKVRTALEQHPYASLQNYLNRYRLERLYYEMIDFDDKLDVRANLEAISTNLDIFYWIEKLKVHSSALSQKRTANIQYDIHFMHEIADYLGRYPLENVPELAVYYYSYQMLQNEDDTNHYFNYKRMLEQFGEVMPNEEAIELYDAALNYCIGKINKGNESFSQEYLDLFADGIRKKIFLTKGELAIWRFNNVVGAALRVGKLDWAETFIEEYSAFLPADSRENAYSFNLARVYRYQQKYDKVLKLLRNVEYEDTGYNLISKAILLITYYELDEFDALDSFSESFRVFLNRHKNISVDRRQSYLNLIRFVRKLIRMVPGDKASVRKLRLELEENRAQTVNFEWLMEKTAELL